MSQSVFLEPSRSFVDNLLSLDNEIKVKIEEGKDKSKEEIYQLYYDRLSLYEKSSILPLKEGDKLLLQDKKEDLYLEFKLFKFKQDIKEQLDEIEVEIED